MRPVEQAVRESFGRLVAILASRGRDLAAAEDALADAVLAALERWPSDGVPERPEAWLVAVARRRLVDRVRRSKADAGLEHSLSILAELLIDEPADGAAFPDERLRLLFVCAHPAIEETIRAPLMLQAVLGLDAARIAAAFLVSPATMGQRLVRAKGKIRDAGIPFAIPETSELPERVQSVLEAIYAAFGSGWDDIGGSDRAGSLADEAIWLGRVLTRLMPDEAEPLGLLALMLHSEARRPARRDSAGRYVPFSEQETGLWQRAMIAEAEATLQLAAAMHRPGRFQIEAAIQSAQVGARLTGEPGPEVIARLHEALWAHAPRIGVAVARAVAVADARGAEAGVALLDELPANHVAAYQPYHAARAELLARAGRAEEAFAAFGAAIALTGDGAIRDHLADRQRRLLS